MPDLSHGKGKKYMAFSNYLVIKCGSIWNIWRYFFFTLHKTWTVTDQLQCENTFLLLLNDDEIKVEIEINYFSISNSFCNSGFMIHYVSCSTIQAMYEYNYQ